MNSGCILKCTALPDNCIQIGGEGNVKFLLNATPYKVEEGYHLCGNCHGNMVFNIGPMNEFRVSLCMCVGKAFVD